METCTSTITVVTASKLSGFSARHIRRLIAAGVLHAVGDGIWSRVPLAAVEQLIGHSISADELAAAQHREHPAPTGASSQDNAVPQPHLPPADLDNDGCTNESTRHERPRRPAD